MMDTYGSRRNPQVTKGFYGSRVLSSDPEVASLPPSLVGRAMATGGGAAEEEMHNESGWVGRPRAPAQSPAMGTPSPAPPAAAPGTPQREAATFEPPVGVGQYYQEGEVPNDSPMTRDPSVRASADDSPALSSASDQVPP